MRKNIICLTLLLFVSLVLVLSACGQDEVQSGEEKEVATETGEYIDVDAVDGTSNEDYDKYNEKETTVTHDQDGNVSSGETSPQNSGGGVSGVASGSSPNSGGAGENPAPIEPQDAKINTKSTLYCTLYVECTTVFDNLSQLKAGKKSVIPADGIIFAKKKVKFYEGESVFDVLKREMENNKIHLEFSKTVGYNSNYIEGIGNLYELDCGSLSGWMYAVNDWFPNYGASRYQLKDGDAVAFHYTCELGAEFGETDINN